MRNVISVAAVFAVAGAASAAVSGVRWAESALSIAGHRTFDLFVDGAVGDTINGVNFGGDNPANGRIRVSGGTVFNHGFGGDNRSFVFEGVFPDIRFDTFATYGGNSAVNGQTAQFAGPVNLTGAGGIIQFTSFTQPPAVLTADAASAGGGSVWVLRVTVTAGTTSLGGTDSQVQVGLPGGAIATYSIANAIPTPGAAALLGLAGLAVARRRR